MICALLLCYWGDTIGRSRKRTDLHLLIFQKPSMLTCESATFSLNQVSVKHIKLAERNSLAYFTFAQSSSILFCKYRTFPSISEGRYGLHPSFRNLCFTPPFFPLFLLQISYGRVLLAKVVEFNLHCRPITRSS